jgi:hypothetical protein
VLASLNSSIFKYQYSSMYLEDVASFCQVLFVLSGIVRYREGSKKHVDDPVPNGDPWSCIMLLVFGIMSNHIRK